MIVAYPPGGVTDVVARLVADRLGPRLGTVVVVENRSGAAGLIGMDSIAKATPDGYTLGVSSVSTLTLTPHLSKMPFDPAHDIEPVVSLVSTPVMLLGTPILKAKTFQELLDQAKAQPGAVRWSTSGQGSLGHIVLEQIKAKAGVDITHIPYRGSSQQLNDALAGLLEVASINPSEAIMVQVREGKMRPLAIGSSARMEALPDVPTLAELGYTEANRSSVFGMFAPAGTPKAIVDKVAAEVTQVLAQQDLRAKLLNMGNIPTGGTQDAFIKAIKEESESNARIIKSANIRLE